MHREYDVSKDGFQFTPPHEGRPKRFAKKSKASLFQFTPPHEGRRRPRLETEYVSSFNSRPRMRGDPVDGGQPMRGMVSIHAPA